MSVERAPAHAARRAPVAASRAPVAPRVAERNPPLPHESRWRPLLLRARRPRRARRRRSLACAEGEVAPSARWAGRACVPPLLLQTPDMSDTWRRDTNPPVEDHRRAAASRARSPCSPTSDVSPLGADRGGSLRDLANAPLTPRRFRRSGRAVDAVEGAGASSGHAVPARVELLAARVTRREHWWSRLELRRNARSCESWQRRISFESVRDVRDPGRSERRSRGP